VKLYSGPKYEIDKSFTDVLLFVIMALFYGTAMPVLYPIAFMGMSIYLVQERILVCKYYRRPPMYDWRLTLTAIKVISVLPILALPFIFWQLGNRQIFDNVLFEIQHMNDVRLSGHTPT